MARNWTENELMIAMNVYCKLPFGKLSHKNEFIVQVAEKMERTPSSVSMKLCNFASFDLALQARGVKGLTGASRADRAMWNAFQNDWEEMSEKSEEAFEQLMRDEKEYKEGGDILLEDIKMPEGPTETERMTKQRRLQRFFRNTVLASYEDRCALTKLSIPQLLIASHIIPWSKNREGRANPTNGICLNALHDRAFDRGLITFDKDYRLVISSQLKSKDMPEFQNINFIMNEGKRIDMPHRFLPDQNALEWHRNNAFLP